ncbi:hypothetical protein RchiOBHm_Chr4g0435601 [Rosa chinensis]|uniref:Uncharacterized protein n=1 Tax=Rosa chinensis TaxID=74649 RepID=A0A2P6R1U4_ROSCH|nr:hypothetical protein RchiOBHm_Chr4g0435601 [Rosa chinensis]
MEFDLSPQFNFDMGMNAKPSLEFLEEDDDEFYAEMRRQIMILTGDQNDDFPETKIVKPSYASVTKPCSLSSTSSQGSMSLWQNEYITNSVAVPVQLANSWGNSTGTGVFIPQSTGRSRRNYKPSL